MPSFSTEFIVGTCIALVLFLVAIFVTMATAVKTKRELWIAIGCLIGSAIIVSYGIMDWQMKTALPRNYRLLITYAFAALMVAGTGELIRWAYGRNTASETNGNNALNPNTSTKLTDIKKNDEKPPEPVSIPPISKTELSFINDFPDAIKERANPYIAPIYGQKPVAIQAQAYWNYQVGQTEFIGFYVPSTAHTYQVCLDLVHQVKPWLDTATEQKRNATEPLHGKLLNSLKFSKVVYIYHEDGLTAAQRAEIVKIFKGNGLAVWLRGIALISAHVRSKSSVPPDSLLRSPYGLNFHPVIQVGTATSSYDETTRKLTVSATFENVSTFEVEAKLTLYMTWNGAPTSKDILERVVAFAPTPNKFVVSCENTLSPERAHEWVEGPGIYGVAASATYADRNASTEYDYVANVRHGPNPTPLDVVTSHWFPRPYQPF